MYIGSLSRRYAKALLAYATENGQAAQVYQETVVLAYRLTNLPALRQVLENPVLPTCTKIRLVCEAAVDATQETASAEPKCDSKVSAELKRDSKVSAELKRFLQLVLKEHREAYLAFMCLSYIDLYRKQQHIRVGELTTAAPVSATLLDRIRSLIAHETHGTVELRTAVDPSLLGGFRLEIGTYRLDASMAHQLERVKKQFVARNRRIV